MPAYNPSENNKKQTLVTHPGDAWKAQVPQLI